MPQEQHSAEGDNKDSQKEPSSNNLRNHNKTPTVILQDDVYSYEILYGNKIDDN